MAIRASGGTIPPVMPNPASRLGQAACRHIRRLCAGFCLGRLANALVPVSMASAAWAGFPTAMDRPGRVETEGKGNPS